MAPKKEFSGRVKARILQDLYDTIAERDKTIILLRKDYSNHIERLQKQLDNERKELQTLSFRYREECERGRTLQSIIKVFEAAIFCLTKKSLQIDTQAGGSIIGSLQTIAQANVGALHGGFGGATPQCST